MSRFRCEGCRKADAFQRRQSEICQNYAFLGGFGFISSAYIKENAHLKITAEDLAEKFFYHKNHINRVIKSETGMNFKMFVMKTKIDLADKLLEDTDMNVTEIANYLNFFDASHFIKCYKKLKRTSNLNRLHY